MPKEVSGKVFVEIEIGKIGPDEFLPCNVYIYLPLNQRMICVRSRGQVFEAESLSVYQEKGAQRFYILDPKIYPETFDIDKNVAEFLKINPMPAAGLELIAEEESSIFRQTEDGTEERFSAENEQQEIAIFSDSDFASEEVIISSDLEKNTEEFTIAHATANEIVDTINNGKITSDISLNKVDKIASDPGDKVNEFFDMGVDENMETKKGGPITEAEANNFKPIESQNRIASNVYEEIKRLEYELIKISDDNEVFVEASKKIELEQDAENRVLNWMNAMSEGADEFFGLNSAQLLSAKLSFSLSKHLNALRGEFGDTFLQKKSADSNAEEMLLRRRQLQNEIRKFEKTLLGIEFLDVADLDESGHSELFSDMRSMKEHIEKHLEELRGTILLNEAEYSKIKQEISRIQSPELKEKIALNSDSESKEAIENKENFNKGNIISADKEKFIPKQDFLTVSSSQEQETQVAVFSALILRTFGYKNSLIDDYVLELSFLFDSPHEWLLKDFSNNILVLHGAISGKSEADNMLVWDIIQAIKLAKSYNDLPGRITGKFTMNAEKFNELCLELIKEKNYSYDRQLLERARQCTNRALWHDDKEQLLLKAQQICARVARWRKAKAQDVAN